MTPDPRDGSMADINADPMPRAQAEVYAIVPASWADIPPIGIPGLILRSLKDRRIVQTSGDGRQWQRAYPLPSPPKVPNE